MTHLSAEALHAEDTRVAALLKVLQISRELAITTDLQRLLLQIEKAALDVLDCERATVFVYDKEADELYSCVATRLEQVRFPAGNGIAGECFRSGKVSRVQDAYSEPRFNRAIDAQTGFRTRNLLTCPLVTHDQTPVGVLQAVNKHVGSFSDWDESLIQTLGAQCGVAMQRQFLLQEFAAKQRIQNELNIAKDIQRGLLPKKAPKVEGYQIAGWNQPADETGGDFFDYRRLNDGRIILVIADVTGHGVGPALVAAECHALQRATFSLLPDIEKGLTHINVLLAEDLPDGRFATAFVGVLTPETHEVAYTSAGQGPLLRYMAARDEFEELPTHGPPLGILPDLPYDESTRFLLEPGDLLLMFTDGFFEWDNPSGEIFGTKRLCEAVRQHRDCSAAEIIQHVYRAVQDFVDGRKQIDDLTGVIVKRL